MTKKISLFLISIISAAYFCGCSIFSKNLKSLEILQGAPSIEKGTKMQFTVYATPSSADISNLVWESSNENIATVDSDGYVTAKNVGECVITVRSGENSSIKNSCTVGVQATYLSDDKKEQIIFYGNKEYKRILRESLSSSTRDVTITGNYTRNDAITGIASIYTITSVKSVKYFASTNYKEFDIAHHYYILGDKLYTETFKSSFGKLSRTNLVVGKDNYNLKHLKALTTEYNYDNPNGSWDVVVVYQNDGSTSGLTTFNISAEKNANTIVIKDLQRGTGTFNFTQCSDVLYYYIKDDAKCLHHSTN